MAKFDDIEVGQFAEMTHKMTMEDLARFVELTGDDNRLHTDASFAAQTSFKKPVAHGMLGASFISTVIGTKLPGDGALWFAQNLEFLLPVRLGDELTIRAEVLRKIDRMNIVELQTDIFNQHRQKVTTGIAKVKIVEQVAVVPKLAESGRRVALVIGGSGGIGGAICRMLASDGFDVAVHSFRNKGAADKIVADIVEMGGSSASYSADISSPSDVTEMVQRVVRQFGTITALINCATGSMAPHKLDELHWSDVDEQLTTTIRGAFNLSQSVIPIMVESGRGKIINITSHYIEAPVANLLPYITAKSALAGYSRALAFDLAPRGIQVNLVSPGMTDTDLIADVPERIRLLTAARTPLRRLALPEDVAAAVSFLASDRSNFVTGETIRVNGGQMML
ncbi:MAG TPA: SDR family oxidoreductase [Dongiaceae bacterium]|nr:SDR family oxidoreductase [Dongiaceae bacterium]